MKKKLRTLTLFICLLLTFNSSLLLNVRAAPSLAITTQPGFPKTEPGGVAFAGPALADLDSNGTLEIMVADGGGCVWGFDHQGRAVSGFPLRPFNACATSNRINTFAVGNIDGDSQFEIVLGTAGSSASSRGKVYAYNHNGSRISGWPKEMGWNTQYANGQPEVYSVALANITGGSALEVLAGTSNNSSKGGTGTENTKNLYVWTGNGTLVSGFPTWYRRAGIYGMIGAGDLTGDAYYEIVPPRDHRWLHAYDKAGKALSGWPVESWVDPANRCAYLSFTRNAPSFADLDGDGRVETIIAGRMRRTETCTGSPPTTLNSGVMVLEPDGTRAPGWGTAKLGDGPPLVEVYDPSQAPAIADLDGDGKFEIVVTLTDGTARVYRHDGSLMWKYDFANGRKLFASEPVIGDVNGNGRLDIIFGTYAPDGSANAHIGLVALNHNGDLISGYPLPLTHETNEKKGIRAAPGIGDIDGDGIVEIVAGSTSGTLYVWDTGAAYNPALMPWPVGRGNNQRNGFLKR